MHKLGVAVVYKVKQIEVSRVMPQISWVVDEAVQQPVSVVEKWTAAHHWQTAETSPHGRSQPGRREVGRMADFQMLRKHVRHQFHARPVFFDHVTDQCDSRTPHDAWDRRC